MVLRVRAPQPGGHPRVGRGWPAAFPGDHPRLFPPGLRPPAGGGGLPEPPFRRARTGIGGSGGFDAFQDDDYWRAYNYFRGFGESPPGYVLRTPLSPEMGD